MDDFRRIVLAGGYGTRLGDIGKNTAKPLLRLGNKTILDYVTNRMDELNTPSSILVLINSLFRDQFEKWLAQKQHSINISLINNQELSDSAVPDIITNIALTLERQDITSDLLLVGADNLFDFSLSAFVPFGQAHGISTIVVDVGSQRDAERFSVVVLGEDQRIVNLTEKPKSPNSTTVTTCIYWFPASTLDLFRRYLHTGASPRTIGEFMEWVARQEPVYGYRAVGRWQDIGTVEDYESALSRTLSSPSWLTEIR